MIATRSGRHEYTVLVAVTDCMPSSAFQPTLPPSPSLSLSAPLLCADDADVVMVVVVV